MQCEVCGRRLKSPISIERGIGPGCWKKINSQGRGPQNTQKGNGEEVREDTIPGQIELDEWLKTIDKVEG